METMTRIFGLDAQLIQDTLLTALAIFILFFVLSYLLFDPVREFLAKRKKKISEELREAEESLKTAEEMKAEYSEKIANAEKETLKILDDARNRAKISRNEILDEARAEVSSLKKKANFEIEQEKVHARDEMKNEMVSVAAALAEKAVKGAMTPEISDELIQDTLRQIGEEKWQDQ